MSEPKTYQVQGKAFTHKKYSFDYRIKSTKLIHDYNKSIREFTEDAKKEYFQKSKILTGLMKDFKPDELTEKNEKFLKRIEENPSLALELIEVNNNLEADTETGKVLFLNDEKNIKRLFEICLEGDTNSINLNPESDEEFEELENFVKELFENFFLKHKNQVKK